MKRTFANRVGLGLTGIFQELHEGALLELEKLRGLLQGFLLRRTVAVAVLASMVMMPHSHHIHTPISLHKMATRALPMPQSCFSPMQQVQVPPICHRQEASLLAQHCSMALLLWTMWEHSVPVTLGWTAGQISTPTTRTIDLTNGVKMLHQCYYSVISRRYFCTRIMTKEVFQRIDPMIPTVMPEYNGMKLENYNWL